MASTMHVFRASASCKLPRHRSAAPRLSQPVSSGTGFRARHVVPKAYFGPVANRIAEIAAEVAERTGEVEAPTWVIFAVAAVVTVVGTAAIPLFLKSGTEAAEQMQARDAKKFNKYDK